jgi:hypothetical protein
MATRNVLDLTKIEQSTRAKITNPETPKTPITPNTTFLGELELSDQQMRCCYFKYNAPSFLKEAYYDLALLKLPKEFQFVEVDISDTNKLSFSSDADDYGDPREVDIYTPLLLNISGDDKPTYTTFHFCSDKNSLAFNPELGKPNGCPPFAVSFDSQFPLFYYKGKLRTHIDEGGEATLLEKRYYLAPMYLSEKTIVYYCLEYQVGNFDKIIAKLQFIQDNKKKVFGADTPLVLNDEMGIFVFRELV